MKWGGQCGLPFQLGAFQERLSQSKPGVEQQMSTERPWLWNQKPQFYSSQQKRREKKNWRTDMWQPQSLEFERGGHQRNKGEGQWCEFDHYQIGCLPSLSMLEMKNVQEYLFWCAEHNTRGDHRAKLSKLDCHQGDHQAYCARPLSREKCKRLKLYL